jgi:hypothetical protein
MNIEKIYIPITFDCSGANTLRDKNLRIEAYPFDWNIKTIDSIYNIINNDFIDLFSNEFLIYSKKSFKHKYDNNNNDYKDLIPVFNIKYNILFVHDFNIEDNFDIIFNKYKKRIDRFINIINNYDNIIFIYDNRYELVSNSIYDYYISFFDDKNIFTNISQKKNIKDLEELILLKYNKKVKFVNVNEI